MGSNGAERTPGPGLRNLVGTGAAAGLVTLLAAALYFGMGVLTGTELFFTHEYASSDTWHLNYPAKHFYAQELRAARWPLWCPEMGTGFPLLAASEVGALYPPNVVLFWLLPLPVAYNLAIVGSLVWAAAATAMFARQLKATASAAVFAGCVFALSGFFVVHVKHPGMIATAAWAPALLLLVERYAARRSRGLLAAGAVAVALCALAGHVQIFYNNVLIAGLYAGVRAVGVARAERPGVAGRYGLGLLSAVALGTLLAAPQLLPTLELHEAGPRRGGLEVEKSTEWEYRWKHLAAWVAPKAFGDPGELVAESAVAPDESGGPPRVVQMLAGFEDDPEHPSLFWEITAYVGLAPLGLALLGLLLARGRSRWGLLALTGGALLLALGKNGGLFYLAHAVVPGFDLFRFHGRFLVYAALGLVVLSALGLGAVLERALRGAHRRWLGAGACAVALSATLFDLSQALGDHNPVVPASTWTAPPPTALRIREAERERRSAAPFRIHSTDTERFVFENAYNRARGWKGDLAPYDPARLMLAPNLNVLFGLHHLDLWSPLYPRWSMRIAQAAARPGHEGLGAAPPGGGPAVAGSGRRQRAGAARIAAVYNVRYLLDPLGAVDDERGGRAALGRWPGDVRLRGRLLVEDPPYEIRLYRDDAAMPRAFLVAGAEVVADGTALQALGRAEFDPTYRLLLAPGSDVVGKAPTGPVDAGHVRFRSYQPQRVELDVEAPRPCWLFLSDTWYPGWQATVDGRAVEIHRANVAGRAVRLDAGSHDVVFAYQPRSFLFGWFATLVAVVVLFALLVTPRLGHRFARLVAPRLANRM